MKMFIIRHGEQIYPYDELGRKLVSSSDAPLSELGKTQLRQLERMFNSAGQSLNALYTSPLERAYQSARTLAEEMHILDIQSIEDLKDVTNGWEGHTYDELEKVGGDIYTHPLSDEPESLNHEVDRLRLTLEYILADAQEKGYESIGIIGHGDPLCALVWSLRHEGTPDDYIEMRNEYYPQKGQAKEFLFNSNSKLESEGRMITPEAAKQTIEGFRNTGQLEAEH